MSDELKPVLDLLGGNSGKLALLIAWVGALRLLAKPISGALQSLMTKLVLFVQGTPEQDDDRWVASLLSNPIYRGVVFLVDYFTSIKLPTSAVMRRLEESSVGGSSSLLLALLVLMVPVVGCQTTLEPGGAYAPAGIKADVPYMTVETGFKAAYASLDFIFQFEYDNRDLLWKFSPEIKHTLDKIRPQAVEIRDAYIRARTIYELNPTPDNLTTMQTVLAKINQLLATADTVVKNYTTK